MKKLFKKKLFSLIFIFSFMLFNITNVFAISDTYVEKQITVNDYVNETESSVNIRLYGQIPYIKLTDFYGLISQDSMKITNDEDGIYSIVTKKGSAVINTESDTLYSGDYAAFVNVDDDDEDMPIIMKGFDIENVGEALPTNIDFTKYDIDLIGAEDIWLPVQTAVDMFMKTGFYDGENLNILDTSLSYDFVNEEEYLEKLANYFEDGMRSDEYSILSYNELCFVFDNLYGYPEQSMLGESIKKNGLDYTLKNYDENTKQIRNWLMADNLMEYFAGLAGLDAYLYDGGHTEISYFLENILDEEMFGEAGNYYGDLDVYKYKQENDSNKYLDGFSIDRAREEVFETENYLEKGDTAIYSFDEFNYDELGWEEYYENGGNYPSDTLGNILTALDKASANPNIKNFVFDISKNGGGLGFVAPTIMAHLGFDNNMREKNMINNQIANIKVYVDINHDGVYDENDKKSKYNFNYAVLTSDVTFSTANIFANFAKENGWMILGEKTSGGACSVSGAYTAEGVFYTISSAQCTVNQNGVSIDMGVDVDADLIEYEEVYGIEIKNHSKFYDIDLLSTEINEFYKNKKATKTLTLTLKNGAKYSSYNELERTGVLYVLLMANKLVKTEENGLQYYKDSDGKLVLVYDNKSGRFAYGDKYYNISYEITTDIRKTLKNNLNSYDADFKSIIQDIIDNYKTVELKFDSVNLLKIETDGYGNINYAYADEKLSYDEDDMFQSAYVPYVGTYKIGAKANNGWKFVKWLKNGEEYSTNSEITVTLDDEDIELKAVFEMCLGEFEKKEISSNIGNANIENTDEELENLIELTSEEMLQMLDGNNLYLFVEVGDISSLVSSEEKTLIERQLDDNSKIGMYLDINLFKQFDGQNKIKISKTLDKIKISFEIPENLRNNNRKFYLIRIHDGVATKIIPSQNGNILTFETDAFSTYALIYEDEKNSSATVTPEINNKNNPKTGDNTIVYFLIVMVGILGFILTSIYAKKRN